VAERQRQLISTADPQYSRIEDLAAAHLAISKEQLASWDASARAWLRAAQESPMVKTRQTKLMLILKNLGIPVSNRPDVYNSVIEAWKLALETMEKILNGGSYSVRDGAVLVALSAWHLYPDLVILGRETQELVQKDDLVPKGSLITIGLSGDKPETSNGVYWPLSLKHLRYYGGPVLKSRSVESDSGRWTFSDFMVVVLGAVLGNWKLAKYELDDGIEFLCILDSATERLSSEQVLPSSGHTWIKPLTAAINRYRNSRDSERFECRNLLYLGWRRSTEMLGESVANFEFDSLRFAELLVEEEDKIEFFRAQVTKLYSNIADHFIIRCRRSSPSVSSPEKGSVFVCSAGPLGAERVHCRWTEFPEEGGMDGERVLPLDLRDITHVEDTTKRFPVMEWSNAPSELGGQPSDESIAGSVRTGKRGSKFFSSFRRRLLEGDRPRGLPALQFRYVSGDANVALYRRAESFNMTGLDFAIEPRKMNLTNLNALLRERRVNLMELFRLCFTPPRDEPEEAVSLDALFFPGKGAETPVCRLLRSLAACQSLYEEIPGATISTYVINCQLPAGRWLGLWTEYISRRGRVDQIWQSGWLELTSARCLNRAQAFAAICMFESGSVNLEPQDLERVFAIDSLLYRGFPAV
jgi:hypothetical protein